MRCYRSFRLVLFKSEDLDSSEFENADEDGAGEDEEVGEGASSDRATSRPLSAEELTHAMMQIASEQGTREFLPAVVCAWCCICCCWPLPSCVRPQLRSAEPQMPARVLVQAEGPWPLSPGSCATEPSLTRAGATFPCTVLHPACFLYMNLALRPLSASSEPPMHSTLKR